MREHRPNVHAENVLAAACRVGDARTAYEKLIRAWKFGDNRAVLDASRDCVNQAETELHRAARAYATRMRRKK